MVAGSAMWAVSVCVCTCVCLPVSISGHVEVEKLSFRIACGWLIAPVDPLLSPALPAMHRCTRTCTHTHTIVRQQLAQYSITTVLWGQ